MMDGEELVIMISLHQVKLADFIGREEVFSIFSFFLCFILLFFSNFSFFVVYAFVFYNYQDKNIFWNILFMDNMYT